MTGSLRLWWIGRLLALAKWMQRTSFALNERADRLLNGPKEVAMNKAEKELLAGHAAIAYRKGCSAFTASVPDDSLIELEVREAIRRVQQRRLPFWWPRG